jgi:hypothetical protein
VHTFSFVAPDLGGQLRALSEGRMPKDWSFDLVVPELLPGARRTTKKYLQASIFFNWPRGMSEDRPMERAWDYILDVLDRHFPGFGRAILWFQRLTPVAYKRTVGLSSVTCPSLSGFQGNDLLQQVPGITGLYAVGGGVYGANSLSALRSGLACGRHIIRKGV